MPEKFIVPQFIDNENKILGPITVRQFLITLLTVFILFLCYSILKTAYFVVSAIIITPIGGAFAFVKVNGQPFHLFVINVLQTSLRPKIRIWNKEKSDAEIKALSALGKIKPITEFVSTTKKRPTNTKLRDLTLIVNTGGVYRPEDQDTL